MACMWEAFEASFDQLTAWEERYEKKKAAIRIQRWWLRMFPRPIEVVVCGFNARMLEACRGGAACRDADGRITYLMISGETTPRCQECLKPFRGV